MSESDKKGIIAQIIVGIVTGIVIGMLTGSGTAFVMVSAVDSKIELHMAENASADAQVRRDIARIEQENLKRDQADVAHEDLLHSLDKSLAVLAGYINERRLADR